MTSPVALISPITSKSKWGSILFIPTLFAEESTYSTLVSTAKLPLILVFLSRLIADVVKPTTLVPPPAYKSKSPVAIIGTVVVKALVDGCKMLQNNKCKVH